METRPGTGAPSTRREGRGSGAGVRPRRKDALGPRKDIIIRMSEETAHRLKVVAAVEGVTVTDFCLAVLVPHIERAVEKCGLTAEQLAR